MVLFDLPRAGAVRQAIAPNSVDHAPVRHEQQRTWVRAALGVAGTVFVLMGVAIGVLALSFILVFAHGFLQ